MPLVARKALLSGDLCCKFLPLQVALFAVVQQLLGDALLATACSTEIDGHAGPSRTFHDSAGGSGGIPGGGPCWVPLYSVLGPLALPSATRDRPSARSRALRRGSADERRLPPPRPFRIERREALSD